jgi:hypothetical protein
VCGSFESGKIIIIEIKNINNKIICFFVLKKGRKEEDKNIFGS